MECSGLDQDLGIQEVSSEDPLSEPELFAFAEIPEVSTNYRVVFQNQEIAIVTLDRYPQNSNPFLYAIFVLKAFRGKGIGGHLLKWAEELLSEEGFETVSVIPKPLDQSIRRDDLICWYEKRGYSQNRSRTDVWSKVLNKSS